MKILGYDGVYDEKMNEEFNICEMMMKIEGPTSKNITFLCSLAELDGNVVSNLVEKLIFTANNIQPLPRQWLFGEDEKKRTLSMNGKREVDVRFEINVTFTKVVHPNLEKPASPEPTTLARFHPREKREFPTYAVETQTPSQYETPYASAWPQEPPAHNDILGKYNGDSSR